MWEDPFKKGNPFIFQIPFRDNWGKYVPGIATQLNNNLYISKDGGRFERKHDSTNVWEVLKVDGTSGSGIYNVVFDSTDSGCNSLGILTDATGYPSFYVTIYMQRNSFYDIIQTIPPRGPGGKTVEIEVLDSNDEAVSGVEVWVTSDIAGQTTLAGTLVTDGNGKVSFLLDAGNYYIWRMKHGINFTNPQLITVTNP